MCVMYININIYIYEIETINLDFNIFRYLALILWTILKALWFEQHGVTNGPRKKGQALTPSQREVPRKGQWLWLPSLSIFSPGDRHTYALNAHICTCVQKQACGTTVTLYPVGWKQLQNKLVLPDKQVSRRNREGCFSALCFLNSNLPL